MRPEVPLLRPRESMRSNEVPALAPQESSSSNCCRKAKARCKGPEKLTRCFYANSCGLLFCGWPRGDLRALHGLHTAEGTSDVIRIPLVPTWPEWRCSVVDLPHPTGGAEARTSNSRPLTARSTDADQPGRPSWAFEVHAVVFVPETRSSGQNAEQNSEKKIVQIDVN